MWTNSNLWACWLSLITYTKFLEICLSPKSILYSYRWMRGGGQRFNDKNFLQKQGVLMFKFFNFAPNHEREFMLVTTWHRDIAVHKKGAVRDTFLKMSSAKNFLWKTGGIFWRWGRHGILTLLYRIFVGFFHLIGFRFFL